MQRVKKHLAVFIDTPTAGIILSCTTALLLPLIYCDGWKLRIEMLSFKFENVSIESFGLNLPVKAVSSREIEERLAPVYKKFEIPFGTLEKLTGVQTRYFWDPDVGPSQVATVAALKALESSGIARDKVNALFSCAITRDYFEPATSCLIHHGLGICEDSITLDIGNACLGFMDGLALMSNLIESGVVTAGIVVSGETITRPMEYCVEYILNDETLDREKLIKLLPTFTLGSGACAYLLCNKEFASSTHRILGGVTKSATEHHGLCNGNGDFYVFQTDNFNPIMTTESTKLISSAAVLGGRMWQAASQVLNWKRGEVDHIFCHQVGKQVNNGFYDQMGLDIEKEFTIYQRYGNMASAALPSALVIGSEEKDIKRGEKVLMTGFGSGLNSLFLGIEW